MEQRTEAQLMQEENIKVQKEQWKSQCRQTALQTAVATHGNEPITVGLIDHAESIYQWLIKDL